MTESAESQESHLPKRLSGQKRRCFNHRRTELCLIMLGLTKSVIRKSKTAPQGTVKRNEINNQQFVYERVLIIMLEQSTVNVMQFCDPAE